MRRLLLLMAALLSLTLWAQERKITGSLLDRETAEPMTGTTVQLLRMDSTFVVGAVSNNRGTFAINAPANGRYLLRISSVGYLTIVRRVELVQDRNLALGKIEMSEDAVLLKGATVTGQAMKVVVKEDTFIYNSAAYRVPEGSMAEELVRRIPGAQIADDGKITINGKQVKKILVDGKEFMTGDTKTAMKNLPTTIIDRIKAYDEKSDLSRVTGIDDGNEQTVLDFGLKPGMNKGVLSNADVAAGSEHRYSGRVMGGYFKDGLRVMGFGNMNNVNDMGFGGSGGGFGWRQDGVHALKMGGINLNYEQTKRLKIDGSLLWNYADGDALTRRSDENFVSRVGAFSNSLNQNYSRSNSFSGNMRLEWMPDTMTNILFRPSFDASTNDGLGRSNSASYNADPYLYADDPLALADIARLAADSMMVNSLRNASMSYGRNKRLGGMLQYNRRLGNAGRNVTFRTDAAYQDSRSTDLAVSNVHLYRIENALGNDSTYQTNRFNLVPTTNWNYSLQATYSEPLWRATFLQFSYKYNYSYSKSDRSTYDFSNLGEAFFDGLTPAYRRWDDYLGRLPHGYEHYLDSKRSRFSEYKNHTHEIELMFRMIRPDYNFNIGVMLQPQKSHFIQHYLNVDTDTSRLVTNFTPTLDFRYRFSKVSNLRINYRGYTSQPSIGNLLDIDDDSDPLNIRRGNPGLKPSFTNDFRLFYNAYIEKYRQAVMSFLSFSTANNSIVNKITYDEKTGGMTSRPENINGNWNVSGNLMYNRSIDSTGVWNVNTWTSANYINSVGYLNVGRSAEAQKNSTRTLHLNERLSASFRSQWVEIELDGSVDYNHSRNSLQGATRLDTWQFGYGLNVTLNTPWGTSLATDLHENSRRGFSDRSMNTNELVWNAQLSQSFLRQKNLTLSLQFYDILRNKSNFSRTVDAMRRSDTWYNSINSYAMLHVIYRLNIFGGKDMRDHGPGFGGPGGRSGGKGNRGGGRMPMGIPMGRPGPVIIH